MPDESVPKQIMKYQPNGWPLQEKYDGNVRPEQA
jgi:hypothetical protein